MSVNTLLQGIVNGLSLGLLYALIAVGYTMVYGILRLINFAHGEVFMMSVYFAFYASAALGLPWFASFGLAVVGAALLGYSIDKIAYKPLRKAPRISALITAVGVSFFLSNLAIVLFSGIPKSFRTVFPSFLNQMIVIGGVEEVKYGRTVVTGGIRIPWIAPISIVVTVICFLLLYYIVNKTRTGIAMRALSLDMPTTQLMGVNINSIISFTFALGSALAAVGGLLWAIRYPQLWPQMGLIPGLKAFIAAVLGGIGSIHGAVVGGLVLGLSEILIVTFFPSIAGYRDVFAFIILVLVLSVRPEGIFGERSPVKV